MASISLLQSNKTCHAPVPFLMRSKFARCLQTSSTLSHRSSLGLDESWARCKPSLDALSVQVSVIGAVSISEELCPSLMWVCFHSCQCANNRPALASMIGGGYYNNIAPCSQLCFSDIPGCWTWSTILMNTSHGRLVEDQWITCKLTR